jgi:DNA-binding MarR family transcriptional regulator
MDDSRNAGAIVLLTRLARVVYRRSSEELLGMRLRQFVTLSYLRDRGPVPQQQMCDMLTIDANNLVLLLNELEDAGHVRRWRDPGDRRRHIVELTARGVAALERAERAQETIEDEVLAALTPAERSTLRELLRRALAAAATPPAAAPTADDASVAA